MRNFTRVGSIALSVVFLSIAAQSAASASPFPDVNPDEAAQVSPFNPRGAAQVNPMPRIDPRDPFGLRRFTTPRYPRPLYTPVRAPWRPTPRLMDPGPTLHNVPMEYMHEIGKAMGFDLGIGRSGR
jgi:hypothetical protein